MVAPELMSQACDTSLSDEVRQRALWPGKALYCNFPSSVHHSGPAAVRSHDTMVTLAEAIWEFGQTPLRVAA